MSGPEFTSELAGRVAREALFDCWRVQLDGGHLTREGLMAIRARLDATTCEFAPGPDLDLLSLDVDAAVAESYGAPLEDMPGRELPEDLGDIPESRW